MKGKTLVKIGGGMVLAVTLSGIALAHEAIRRTGPEQIKYTENEEESVSLTDFPVLDLRGVENKTGGFSLSFSDRMQGVRGDVSVSSRQTGVAHIRMRLDQMMRAPSDRRLVLWAFSAHGRYLKLGQIINLGERPNAEIWSETYLREFDVFLTLEKSDVSVPTGPVAAAFRVTR